MMLKRVSMDTMGLLVAVVEVVEEMMLVFVGAMVQQELVEEQVVVEGKIQIFSYKFFFYNICFILKWKHSFLLFCSLGGFGGENGGSSIGVYSYNSRVDIGCSEIDTDDGGDGGFGFQGQLVK